MPVFLPAAILGLPVVLALLYVLVWPRTSRRRVVVGVVGALVGVATAFTAIIWAMFPLTEVGIAGIPMDAVGETSISMLRQRVLLAAAGVVVASLATLVAMHRAVGTNAAVQK